MTYACSVDLGTNVYGFEWLADNDITTIAGLIDTLVDSINNVAGMKDTVTAEDSVTYIKLISRFGQQRLEGAARWTFVPTDSLSVSSDSPATLTVAMVCDSMVATINGTAALSDSVTAANDGDTVYTLTADRAGWAIYCSPGDTAQDTVIVTANKASWSYGTDSLPLFSMLIPHGYKSLWGDIILSPSLSTGNGYGLADTGWIWLYAAGAASGSQLVDSAFSEGLPCTLHVAVASNDTLWREELWITATIADSATDTSGSRAHALTYRFIAN
jgi:hypothetical protein